MELLYTEPSPILRTMLQREPQLSRLVNGAKARAEGIAFLGSLLLAFKSVSGGSVVLLNGNKANQNNEYF